MDRCRMATLWQRLHEKGRICLCPVGKWMYRFFQRGFLHSPPPLKPSDMAIAACLAWIPSIIQKPQRNNKQQTRGLADPSSSNRQLCGPETTIYQQANVSGSSGPRPTVRVNSTTFQAEAFSVVVKHPNDDCIHYSVLFYCCFFSLTIFLNYYYFVQSIDKFQMLSR